jgi:hypothetical protein
MFRSVFGTTKPRVFDQAISTIATNSKNLKKIIFVDCDDVNIDVESNINYALYVFIAEGKIEVPTGYIHHVCIDINYQVQPFFIYEAAKQLNQMQKQIEYVCDKDQFILMVNAMNEQCSLNIDIYRDMNKNKKAVMTIDAPVTYVDGKTDTINLKMSEIIRFRISGKTFVLKTLNGTNSKGVLEMSDTKNPKDVKRFSIVDMTIDDDLTAEEINWILKFNEKLLASGFSDWTVNLNRRSIERSNVSNGSLKF